MIKILFIQFANSMFNYTDECSKYWDAFYNRYNDFGYWRGKYTFEIPQWIAMIDYLLDKSIFEREVFYCKNNIREVIDKIKEYKPQYTLFSLMDCNKTYIEDIIKQCNNNQFIIGGYNDKFLHYLEDTYKNTQYAHTIEDEAKIFNVEYKMGTDYSLFKGETVLPRLTLSHGCLNHCKFCTIPHGKVIPIDKNIILQQVLSFKDLKYQMIYLDDKTYGQSDNFKILKELTKIIKEYNKDFKGYVVQTTSGMFYLKHKIFEELDIKVVEIGMETYNNSILKAYNKPSNEHLVDNCINLTKNTPIKLILNVVIGFPEETEETYGRTVHLIEENLSENVFGINPAIYTDYNSSSNKGEIDFQDSDKIELHRKYWKIINNLGREKLNVRNQ